MKQPLVSIIIPVFNEEKYIEDCLLSLSSQTYNNIEIICVDDGSTDGSIEKLYAVQKKDARIKIIKQTNQYAGIARNRGLDAASGEYCLFLDSDDFFSPNLVSEMLNKALETDADIVLCSAYGMNESTKETYKMPEVGQTNKAFPNKNIFSPLDVNGIFQMSMTWAWDKLYKSEFIKSNGIYFQNTKVCNDIVFVCMSYVLSNKITCVNKNLICHRTHIASSLYNAGEKNWGCLFDALKLLKSELLTRGLYYKYEKSYINLVADNIVYYLLMRFSDSKYFDAFYDYYKNEFQEVFGFNNYSEGCFTDCFTYKLIHSLDKDDKVTFLLKCINALNTKCSHILGDMNAKKWSFPRYLLDSFSSIMILGNNDIAHTYYSDINDCQKNIVAKIIEIEDELNSNALIIPKEEISNYDLYIITTRNYSTYLSIRSILISSEVPSTNIKWVNTICAESWLSDIAVDH